MDNSYKDQLRLEAAKKRVKAIKGFYRHLRIFLTVTIVLAVLYVFQVEPIVHIGEAVVEREAINKEVMRWIDLNLLVNLAIWAIILLVHGLVVFNFRFIRDWEERQLQKYLEEE